MIIRQSILAFLAATTPGALTQTYQVQLIDPQPAWWYENVINGHDVEDFKRGTDGTLDVFPCSAQQGPQPSDNRERLMFPIDDRWARPMTFQLPDFPTHAGRDVAAWEVNYWWGHYDGGGFDNSNDSAYTWALGLPRRHRVSSNWGQWCSPLLTVPEYRWTLGRGRAGPVSIDRDWLHGTTATLAVQFSHYNLDDDLDDPNLMPTNVTTACVFVQFTMVERPIRAACDEPDLIIDGPVLTSEPPWETSTPSWLVGNPEPTPVPTTTTTDDGLPWWRMPRVSPTPDPDSGRSLDGGNIISITIGAGFGIIALLFCCCWGCRICCRRDRGGMTYEQRRELRRAQRLELEHTQRAEDEGMIEQRRRELRERHNVVSPQSPAPVHVRSSPSQDGPPRNEMAMARENREAVSRGGQNGSNDVEELPPYAEPPPRYEEVPPAPPGVQPVSEGPVADCPACNSHSHSRSAV